MELLAIVCFVVAIVLFILAGFSFPRGNPPTVHVGWFGMAFLAVGLWVQFT